MAYRITALVFALSACAFTARACESDSADAITKAQSFHERHLQAQEKFAADEKAGLALTPEEKRQWREGYQTAISGYLAYTMR